MPIIYRYILRHFFSMFLVVAPGLAGIFFIVDAFEHLDEFVEANASMSTAALYFVLKLPSIFCELHPLTLLLSTLLTVALLTRHCELLALRSVGVRPGQILAAFIGIAFLLSTLTFVLKAFYVPSAMSKAQQIWNINVKHSKPKGVLQGNKILYHGIDSIWSATMGSPDATILKRVNWLHFDDRFHIKRMVAAPEAEYQPGKGWVFKHGIELISTDEKGYVSKIFKTKAIKGLETPSDFVSLQIPPEEQSLPSLWKNIVRMKKLKFSSVEQETLFWSDILYPFLGVTLVIAGLPITLARGRWGIGAGLGLGVFMGFLVWSAWSLALTLGNTGILPVPVAPILLHMCLLGTGAILTARMRF